jgi:hypothetical protein
MTQANPELRWIADGREHVLAYGESRIRVSVQDEAGKIDINAAPDALLHGLLRSVGVDGVSASRLVDASEPSRQVRTGYGGDHRRELLRRNHDGRKKKGPERVKPRPSRVWRLTPYRLRFRDRDGGLAEAREGERVREAIEHEGPLPDLRGPVRIWADLRRRRCAC